MSKEVQKRGRIDRDEFYREDRDNLQRGMLTNNQDPINVAAQKTLENSVEEYLALVSQTQIFDQEVVSTGRLTEILRSRLDATKEKTVNMLHNIIAAPTANEKLPQEKYDAIHEWVKTINRGPKGDGKFEGAKTNEWSAYQPSSYDVPEALKGLYSPDVLTALEKGKKLLGIYNNQTVLLLEEEKKAGKKMVALANSMQKNNRTTGFLAAAKKDAELRPLLAEAENIIRPKVLTNLSATISKQEKQQENWGSNVPNEKNGQKSFITIQSQIDGNLKKMRETIKNSEGKLDPESPLAGLGSVEKALKLNAEALETIAEANQSIATGRAVDFKKLKSAENKVKLADKYVSNAAKGIDTEIPEQTPSLLNQIGTWIQDVFAGLSGKKEAVELPVSKETATRVMPDKPAVQPVKVVPKLERRTDPNREKKGELIEKQGFPAALFRGMDVELDRIVNKFRKLIGKDYSGTSKGYTPNDKPNNKKEKDKQLPHH